MAWMVLLEPWDTVGVHPRIYFVEMHHIAYHKVNIFVGGFFEIMCPVSASILEVGTISYGLDGAVGAVGHHRGSPSHSFVEMHRITQHNVNIFVGGFSKLCAPCTRVFSKWAQPHMVWMVSLEPWDTVGVHPRIHFQKGTV